MLRFDWAIFAYWAEQTLYFWLAYLGGLFVLYVVLGLLNAVREKPDA